jgi:hypothetical protein
MVVLVRAPGRHGLYSTNNSIQVKLTLEGELLFEKHADPPRKACGRYTAEEYGLIKDARVSTLG